MPLVEEPYVTTFSDYEASIRFILTGFQPPEGRYRALLPTWKKLAEQMMEDEDFGQIIEKKKIYKNWLSDNNIDLPRKKDMAHAIEIYQTVQNYFEWDESYWTYATRDIKDILEERKATSGEINIFLTGLFRYLGFEAYPALLSTRSNGQVFSAYPLFNQFNHPKVEDKYITLDASDRYCKFAMLPTAALNEQAFLLMGETPQWIPINANFPLIENGRGTATIHEDGSVEIDYNCNYEAAESATMRRAFYNKKSSEEDFARNALFDKDGEEIIINEYSLSYEDPEKPFSLNCKAQSNNYATKAGEFIYLQPMLGQGFDENPFKLKKRSYPVDFARPMQWSHNINFRLLSGYEVESLPKAVNMVLPNEAGNFKYGIVQNGPFLQLQSIIVIRKPRFEPEEYENIKLLFDHISAKHGEQIVLKKKTK